CHAQSVRTERDVSHSISRLNGDTVATVAQWIGNSEAPASISSGGGGAQQRHVIKDADSAIGFSTASEGRGGVVGDFIGIGIAAVAGGIKHRRGGFSGSGFVDAVDLANEAS